MRCRIKIFICLVGCFCCLIRGNSQFAKGVDLGWLTEMEAANRKFYYLDNKAKDCMELLSAGKKWFESTRLRIFVDPQDGWCNLADVLVKAKRAKKLGYRIMLDFQYGDTWTGPDKQAKPKAWASLSYTQLLQKIYDYSREVMLELQRNDIHPEWVQVGNETNDGMLWPDGRLTLGKAKEFAEMVNKGYDAVKSVNTSAKVIVHLGAGADNALCRWVFDQLQANGAKWDVIGVSLYPDNDNWETYTTLCLNNLNDMIARYGKEVMICETDMAVDQPMRSLAFLSGLIKKVKAIPQNKGLGVFYWEPECGWGWPVENNYGRGAFGGDSRPTAALIAFMCTPLVFGMDGTGSLQLRRSSIEARLPAEPLKSIPVIDMNVKDLADSISIFPNPASDELNLKIPLAYIDGKIELLDINGIQSLSQRVNSHHIRLSTRALTPGVYFLQLYDKKGTKNYSKQVLIIR